MVTTAPRPFGALVRQFDPTEIKYSYPAVPKSPNWEIPVGAPKDTRSPIWDQGMVGSCTSSIIEAIETMCTVQGRPWSHLSHEDVYWRGRARDNFFGMGRGADTGAYIASVADEALLGICREDLWPYDGAAWEGEEQHPEAVADRLNQDWLVGHRAIYPGPGADIQIYDALSRGCMVLLGWFLTSEMYDPHGTPYRTGLTRDPHGQHGVHASFISRYFRHQGEPYLVVQQSWGESLNAGIERWNPTECRTGEVVAPLEWATRTDGPAFEFRVLDLAPYTPPPDPPPPPDRGYTEGYDDRRDQDLDFIDGMIRFYREQGTEFATIAGMVCHYAYEMMHDFQPPHAAPALPQPPTMKG